MDLTLHIPEGHKALAVVGPAERNLKMIREALGVTLSAREGTLRITGDQPEVVIAALGDSLTQGYGLPQDEGFVPQLQAWLMGQLG